MKYLISLCIITILILTSVNTALSYESLAAAWLFDEGSGKAVEDSLGNLEGEIIGSVKHTEDSVFGSALEFPGKGESYVSIPHDDILDSESYTFTAWVKLEPLSWQYIAWKNGLTWPETHAKRHIDIWVHDADYVVIMWSFEGGADYARVDGTTIVADGQWHHIAKSSDGDMMRLFIDGELDGEAPIGGNLVMNGEDALWIGARPGDVAATGVFDEVGFFTKALSEDELIEVMNTGLAELAEVSSSGKIATVWGKVKSK